MYFPTSGMLRKNFANGHKLCCTQTQKQQFSTHSRIGPSASGDAWTSNLNKEEKQFKLRYSLLALSEDAPKLM